MKDYWAERVKRQGFLYVGNNKYRSMDDLNRQTSLILPFLRSAKDRVAAELDAPYRVLDFGCGWGRFCEFFSFPFDWVGIDICEAAAKLSGNPKISIYDGDDLPYKDGVFSLVLAIFVFQHIVDDSELRISILEIVRVLKDNGFLFVVDNAAVNRKFVKSRPGLVKMLKAYGFQLDFETQILIDGESHNVYLFCWRPSPMVTS